MSPILQCYPVNQAALVARAGVYSRQATKSREFISKAAEDEVFKKRGRSQNFKQAMAEEKVLAAISGDKCTPFKTAKAAGMNETSVKVIMKRLYAQGRLHRVDSGRKLTQGATYFYSKPEAQ